MKNIHWCYVFILLFCCCEKSSQEPICFNQELIIVDLERKIDELFQENGKLKEQLENCERFIREKDSLNLDKK